MLVPLGALVLEEGALEIEIYGLADSVCTTDGVAILAIEFHRHGAKVQV